MKSMIIIRVTFDSCPDFLSDIMNQKGITDLLDNPFFRGRKGARTPDLPRVRRTLSRLSYTPKRTVNGVIIPAFPLFVKKKISGALKAKIWYNVSQRVKKPQERRTYEQYRNSGNYAD